MPAIPCMRHALWRRATLSITGAACAILLAACGSVPLTPSGDAGGTRAGSSAPAAGVPALPPAGSGRGAYYQDDGPGDRIPEDVLATPDAEPKVEPYTTRGNRPYVVFGKSYTPFTDDREFRQRGRGSWYGKKFHGQRTSSGEIYDMYKMTAAHPTLPLPSYVRVTNVANGRQVIVRVNDRGPFHSSRIIDLSYTAALKLGYLQQGSAELEVERLLPEEIARMTANRPASASAPVAATPVAIVEARPMPVSQPGAAPGSGVTVYAVPAVGTAAASIVSAASAPVVNAAPVPVAAPGFYLQLGAYSQPGSAEAAREQLQRQWAGAMPPFEVQAGGAWYRVFSGPFGSREEAAAAAQRLQEAGAGKAMVVQR